jgi:hypothetical protein
MDDLILEPDVDIKVIDNLQESLGEGMRVPENDETGSDEDEGEGEYCFDDDDRYFPDEDGTDNFAYPEEGGSLISYFYE